MRVRPFVARKCGEKIRFDSYAEAWKICKSIWKLNGERMVPYRCPLCNLHHIGHAKNEDDKSTAFVNIHMVAKIRRPGPPPVPPVPKIKKAKTTKPVAVRKPKQHVPPLQKLPRGSREKQMRYRDYQRMDDDGWNLDNRPREAK